MAGENELDEEIQLLDAHSGEVTVEDDGFETELAGEDEEEEEEQVIPIFQVKVSHEAKLRELLRNLVSVEIKLCSDGSKEFIRLLRGSSGGELLHEYVRRSSKLSEIMEAWRIRQGKSGLSYILSLISVILDHPEGKFRPNDPPRNAINRPLDKFAKSIIEEKLEDLYKELNSKDGKRQKTVLLLLAAIVRRGSGLASEVSRVFDFSLPVFPLLAEYRRKRVIERRKHSTREAFIEFAMSFLEVGNPGLLRWIIQKKEMFSGILRGLGSDDDETVVFVLSTLRDHVLIPDSLVPPALRSVLFGSVTLEQLIGIAARENEGLVAEVAHKILVMACTDPDNGLMPDMKRKISPLRGNPKRLLDLMKKLKLTEVKYHKELILAIVDGKPSLGSAYLDEFPYNVEDHSSPLWYSVVSLAADLISSVHRNLSWEFLRCDNHDPPTLDSSEVQTILKCVFPRPFSRSVISKGLQHSEAVVKHAALKLLLEKTKLFESFTNALCTNGLTSLKEEILNEVRTLLPDPQVLFALLNSMGSHYKSRVNSRKRAAHHEIMPKKKKAQDKKLKLDVGKEDDDILVGGIMATDDASVPQQSLNIKEEYAGKECGYDFNLAQISELWDMPCSATMLGSKDAEMFFLCKVLEVLKIYHCALRSVMEASYDLFKIIPSDPMELPSSLLESLQSVLLEHIDWPPKLGRSSGFLPPIYRNLPSFITLLLLSSTRKIKHQAYTLAQAAMFSTGAFDANPSEIGAWFIFLPGYTDDHIGREDKPVELNKNIWQPIVSFLCDAVSTVGNNLLKYSEMMKCHLSNMKIHGDFGISFSPLIVCILEKCLRVLSSESGSFSLPEKTMITMYVSNTVKYLLETQVEFLPMSHLVYEYLSEKMNLNSLLVAGPDHVSCEYRPLLYVLRFMENALRQPSGDLYAERKSLSGSSSFPNALDEVKKVISGGSCHEIEAVSRAFYSLVTCADPGQILLVSPLVLIISLKLYGYHLWPITQLCFLDHSFLVNISQLWPEIFTSGLEMSELLKPIDLEQSKGDHKQASRSLSMFGCKLDPESLDMASIVFGTLLDRAPFHVIFPAIVINGCLEPDSEVKEFLCDKLSRLEINQLILSLRLVLFWMHQIQSTYRKNSSDKLISLLKICCAIVEHILAQVFGEVGSDCPIDANPSLSLQHARVVMETIFTHPAIALSFSSPLLPCNDYTGTYSGDSLEWYSRLFEQSTHAMDRQIFYLLSVTCNHMMTLCRGHNSVGTINFYIDKIKIAFNAFVKQIFSLFKEKFDICVGTHVITTLFPSLYAMVVLMPYFPPLESLEVAHWTISRTISQDSAASGTSSISPLCLGFILAAYALKMSCSHTPRMDTVPFDVAWSRTYSRFTFIFEDIYFQAVEVAIKNDFGAAYLCMIESIGAVFQHDYRPERTLLSAEMARMIFWTPMLLLSHCLHATDKPKSKKLRKRLFMLPKSKLMLLLIEYNPLHMSVFGHLILDILKHNKHSLHDDDYLMLLPAALTYHSHAVTKFGKEYASEIECIPSFYGSFIIDGWRKIVFKPIFDEEFRDTLPSTTVELLNLMRGSLLGKTVCMLKSHFASDCTTIEERSVLLKTICPMDAPPNEVLCCNIKEMHCYTGNQLLNTINRVVAQISLCKALLFPDGSQSQFPSRGLDDDQNLSKSNMKELSGLKLLNMLVRTWKLLVTNFSSESNSDTRIKYSFLIKFLEEHILKSVADLTEMMCGSLVQLDSLPFLTKIMKCSLLHRFNDPCSLSTFRCILSSLSQGHWPAGMFLQLLLGHSQLASTLRTVSDLSSCVVSGMFLKPISSIFRSLAIASRTNSNAGKLKGNNTQLEVIKLLRILFHMCVRQCTTISVSDMGVNIKELLFLLLSSYGATMCETDLEIYGLMLEIESADDTSSGCLSELEYLWGDAAMRFRKQVEQDESISIIDSDEMKDDRRRSLFRDNLPIDPKICVATVLHFPYHRTESEDPFSFNKFLDDNNKESVELGQAERYDPAFLLRFSIHCLTVRHMDVMEFSGMGLLAIALVSISSPSEGIRKLGYEVLGRFRDSLEKFQKKREVMRLRLLMTFLQNGIEEQWQKIPSVSAVFAAEASVSLLDPSHEHYSAMSKLFMQFSHVKVKSIPLLEECILNNGVNFRADRFWMLRLLYTGVNMEDDAIIFLKKSTHHNKRIFLNNSILELLMTLHASPLTDTGSKELILEILKKSVKLEKIALHLVKHCGLLLWLSSILSTFMSFGRNRDPQSLKELLILLEVAYGAVSSVSSKDWLTNQGHEQLLDLSSHLFRMLVSNSKSVHQNDSLANSILRVLLVAMEISHERGIYQPHFSLSLGALYHIYESSIGSCSDSTHSVGAALRLRAILLNTPPTDILHMGHEEVSQFLSWAVSTSLNTDSSGHVLSVPGLASPCAVVPARVGAESLPSKLLRWLVASVIAGRISSNKQNGSSSRATMTSNVGSLLSLMNFFQMSKQVDTRSLSQSETTVAVVIFHLQQLLGMKCRTYLPSVAAALSMLLLAHDSSSCHNGSSELIFSHGNEISSFWSKIRCPVESRPSWRWSFHQPWADPSTVRTKLEDMDELHACEALLLILSGSLRKRTPSSQILSYRELEECGIFEWERSILESKGTT